MQNNSPLEGDNPAAQRSHSALLIASRIVVNYHGVKDKVLISIKLAAVFNAKSMRPPFKLVQSDPEEEEAAVLAAH